MEATKRHFPSRSRVFPVYPLLLGIFPVVSLTAHNRFEVHLAWALLPVAFAACLTMVAWGIFWVVLRDWTKAALPASLAMLLFFGFGHFVRPLIEQETLLHYQLFLPVILAQLTTLLALCILLRRLARPVLLTHFANVAAAVTVLVPLVALVRHELSTGDESAPAEVAELATSGAQRPDIYLIVPDAHARGDVLRDVYGYDAEPFFTELESLGFAVARQSTSNYSMTPVSIASMLSFNYLPEQPDLEWGDLSLFTEIIRESPAEDLLTRHGYKTVAFPSAASYTEMHQFDEYHRGLGAALGFYRLVVDLTPLAGLLENHPTWNELLSDRERILRTLEDLPVIARDPEPTFTFVHLSLPHPPFQFGENGEDVFSEYRGLDDDGIGSRSPEAQQLYSEAYRKQTVYTNRRLLEVVQGILRDSATPPVIMIVSDHGPRLNFHWRDAQLTDPREALGNLTAVYLPGDRARELIYPTVTPVNVMRTALNEALGTDLPLLEDRAFLSTNVNEVHQLADVTWRARQHAAAPAPLAGADRARPQRSTAEDDASEGQTEDWLAPLDPTPLLR